MEILVTGSHGFIGRNLISYLKQDGCNCILEYDINTAPELLDEYARRCEFVFHLAGVNRPDDPSEFINGNVNLTNSLLDALNRHANKAPVLMTSSIQAELDNPYGRSKKTGENLVFTYADKTENLALVYRLPNVFGKWCRPNYNSVVATFCHNIAHGLPIAVNDPEIKLSLVYIDDVVAELVRALEGHANQDGRFCAVEPVHTVNLGQIVELLENFRNSRKSLNIPNLSDEFVKKLYSTYLSYLSINDFSYPLKMNKDDRGSFTEFIRTPERGQVSVNISKPGITKGNHWHHTKNEKFLVVSGEGIIHFRAIDSENTIEYHVSGSELCVVDIPPGYVHSIENTGDRDMVTLMWANECFNPNYPDTYANLNYVRKTFIYCCFMAECY